MKCLDEEEVKSGIPYMFRTFLQATPYFWLKAKFNPGQLGSDVRTDVDAIGKVMTHLRLNGPPVGPTFMLIHHLSPHPPYMFKADCSFRNFLWSEEGRPLYIDNLRCTNSKLLEFTRFVAKNDPEAIVVIQGDHGTAFKTDWLKPLKSWSEESSSGALDNDQPT